MEKMKWISKVCLLATGMTSLVTFVGKLFSLVPTEGTIVSGLSASGRIVRTRLPSTSIGFFDYVEVFFYLLLGASLVIVALKGED